ncbi:MAG TPA: hypothetical protein VL978_02835 [Puia sp.]|nr:hypothetical protein [Puia sp.]
MEYGLANLIAWPLAYAVTDKWLRNFACRTTRAIVPYLAVGAIIFALAFLLITAQCWRTARANPVNSLRME